MLPVPADTTRSLTSVLTAALASIAGEESPIALPRAVSAVVVLIDGLGVANLQARAGHARFLASRMSRRDVIRTVFPSTTAAAIASFATGCMPGEHGLVGYKVLDDTHDRLVNQLSGWDAAMLPEDWQTVQTVFEHANDCGVRAVAVGQSKYATSGYTRAVLRGAEYVPGATIAERVEVAVGVVDAGPSLVYLYIPELDQLAHAHGWESDRWLVALEEVDAAISDLARRLPADAGLLVTADHGVIDVPAHRHVFIDARAELLEGVRHIGGEPRNLALYFEPDLDDESRNALVEAWKSAEGHRSWVVSRDEAVAAGLYGPTVTDSARARIGDILVFARAGIAYYDSREPNRSAEKMIGQHGSISDEETRIPLIRGGAFTRDTGGA